MSRKLRQLGSRRGANRIASPIAEAAVVEAYKVAKRRNFGFTDRTGRLRRSLRVEQARTSEGRYASGWQLVAAAPYARFVEFRRRTRDRRKGPPYWIGRAFELARRRMTRAGAQAGRTAVVREARRGA